MQRLVQLLYRLRHFSLFLLLEAIALYASFEYSAHYKTAFFGIAGAINGYVLSKQARISDLFHLKEENRALLRENAALRAQLRSAQYRISAQITTVQDTAYKQQYTFIPAKIVSISTRRRNNKILIDRGTAQGVAPDMGVITNDGIVGIVDAVSKYYARVIPVISSYMHTNVRLEKSNFFGFLSWDGADYRMAQLEEIPKYALMNRGDTLVSDSKSALFPAGIPVGTIWDVKRGQTTDFYAADVRLFIDFAKLRNVYVVKNLIKAEVDEVEVDKDK